MFMMGIMYTFTTSAQVDCNSIMVCNDGVQISLDDNCSVPVVASLILEAQAYSDAMYTVEVRTPNGTIVPVSYTHLDVYKRQVQATFLKFRINTLRLCQALKPTKI